MAVKVRRREFLAGAAGAAVTVSLAFPAIAQPKPVRIGVLTVKTGPLAAGGIQMEQGTIRLLKDRSYTLAGRKVELIVADTGGNPAGTKTKTQELVERDHVDMIFGPLAAFELLAITEFGWVGIALALSLLVAAYLALGPSERRRLRMPALLLAMIPALQFDAWQWLSLTLAAPVVTWGAWPFHQAAWRNLRHATATMDTLISIGVRRFTWTRS